MEKNYDIIICGAGPAGSTCALALGKSGLKVAMVDKGKFPRDKICGDALAGYIGKVLNTIDPEYAAAFENFSDRKIVDTVRIVAPNKKALDLNFAVEGSISMRVKFDDFLFQLAGKLPNVTVYQESQLKDIQVNSNGITADLSNDIQLKAKIIIGCDGAQGIVNKKLGNIDIDLNHYAGAVRGYYKNVKEIPDRTFELHFIDDILPGYFWIFPLNDNYSNVGIGILSKTIAKRKMNLRNEMIRIIETVPYIKERFKDAELIGDIKGFGLPLGSRRLDISGERFMLCGDAASLIDPATGEGIGQAMISGRYAGWHAMKCFEKNDFSGTFMKQYDKMVYDKLWKENYSRYMLQKTLDHAPWLFNIAVGLANRSRYFEKLIKRLIW